MELRQLRAFLAVIECGSLGDAARRLKIAQPSLTKSIQSLERSVGGSLFLRSPHGMKPTALARVLETRARVISGEVGRATRAIGDLVEGKRGRVVVGSGPSFAHSVLSRALPRFHRSHPGIEVAVIPGNIRDLRAAVRNGDIDYSFHSFQDDVVERDLTSEVILTGQTTVLVSGAENPLARKRHVSLKEIWPGPWVLPRRNDFMRERLEWVMQRAGLPPPEIAIELGNMLMAPSFLRDSNLLTVLIDASVRDALERKVLALVRVPELNWKLEHRVTYRRGVPLPLAAQQLLEEIRKTCAAYRP